MPRTTDSGNALVLAALQKIRSAGIGRWSEVTTLASMSGSVLAEFVESCSVGRLGIERRIQRGSVDTTMWTLMGAAEDPALEPSVQESDMGVEVGEPVDSELRWSIAIGDVLYVNSSGRRDGWMHARFSSSNQVNGCECDHCEEPEDPRELVPQWISANIAESQEVARNVSLTDGTEVTTFEFQRSTDVEMRILVEIGSSGDCLAYVVRHSGDGGHAVTRRSFTDLGMDFDVEPPANSRPVLFAYLEDCEPWATVDLPHV